MQKFKKILCPVDFSEPSRQALQYAKAFADVFQAKLVTIHVTPNITDVYSAMMPDFPVYGLKKVDDIQKEFNEFTGDWAGKLKKVVQTGTPYHKILEYAEEQRCDLIILGAKGHSNFERLFLGATGEKIVRSSDLPVLTVHPKPNAPLIKKILVPIDFSPLSYAVLPQVATIAQKFDAEIYLLHIVETGHHTDTEGQAKEYAFFEKIKSKLEKQWALPEQFEKIVTHKFIRHHIGPAGYGILEFAHDFDIDLITMATHGRSGLSKVLLGSVTEKVLRIAPCPVLSIRSRIPGTGKAQQKKRTPESLLNTVLFN